MSGAQPPRRPLAALAPLFVATALLTMADGSLGLLLSPYLGRRGVEEAVIGSVIACAGLASFLTRVPAGLSYRRHRAGGLLLLGAAASSAVLLALPAFGHPLPVALLVAVDGAGFALGSTIAMASAVDHRPEPMSLGSLLGWFTGSIGAGYALAGFVAGSLSDAIGIGGALRAMAVVPPLAAVVMRRALAGLHAGRAPDAAPRPRVGLRTSLAAMPPGVWAAFALAFYINLVNGSIHAFFPLYGLAIGLSLTQIGALSGIHATLASAVRFGSGPVFRRVGYRALIPALVLVSGTAVVLLGVVSGFVAFAVTFSALGLARGVLRVASGALAVEAAGSSGERGGASGIYLAGLDLGNVLGPLAGGAVAGTVGLRAAFPVIGVAYPLVYLALGSALAALARSRGARGATLY